ncbi:ATP-binding protein [Elusimicrobiota bacterium]
MKLEDLKLIIAEGESLLVEFKEKYSSKIDRDIVAFSNTKGGTILLGVNDNGKIIGEKLTNKVKAEINDVARKCEPSIVVKKISQIDKIIAIEIDEGNEKPYSCRGGYFRRLDAITQKMSQREVRAIFRETDKVSFEDLVCKSFDFNDVLLKKVKLFLQEAEASYKVNKSNLHSFFRSLGLCNDQGKINNAGVLMFASKIDRFVFHSEIILAAFKGNDKRYIYDRKDVKDDLLTQLNEAITFLKKHLNVRSEIREINRHDIYEIPLDALREAILNAIIHRDYSIRGTSIYVCVYDDRVEVENPGGLLVGVKKQDFDKSSIRRNPIIADLFNRMGKVERMGSGIKNMRNFMDDAGLKEPEFDIDSFFRVIFHRDPRYSLKRTVLEDKETREETRIKSSDKGSEESSDKILELIRVNNSITAKVISNNIGITQRAVEKQLAKLKKEGYLKRVGSKKYGHWEITKKDV